MKILNLIHVMVAQAFYRWAMREINPMDPDLPRIMQRQSKSVGNIGSISKATDDLHRGLS